MTPFRRFIRLAIRIGIPLMMVPVATLSGTSPVRRGSFFLESADVSDWEALLPLGLFCGVATSPVLLQRANVACSVQSCRQLAIDALGMGVDEVMLQTWGEAPDAMVACALGMHEGESRIVIKVPATETGTRAAAELVSRGVRVCLTGVYAAHQALVALGLGLDYIAPHLGRMDDAGKDGPAEVEEMLAIIEGGGGSTRVVGAGLRHVDDLSSMTRLGVRTSLLRPSVARMLFELEPLTDAYAVAAEAAAKALMPPGWRRFDPSLRDASVPAARRYFRAGDNEIELITFFAGWDADDDDDDQEDEEAIYYEVVDDFDMEGNVPGPGLLLPRVPTADEMVPGHEANLARAAIAKHFHSERVLTPADAIKAVEEAKDEAESLFVIDVSTPAERAAVRDAANGATSLMMPHAVSVPLEDIVGGTAYLPEADSGATLILVCCTGTKSLVALDFLYDRFELVYVIDGGVAAWQAAGLPMEPAKDSVSESGMAE